MRLFFNENENLGFSLELQKCNQIIGANNSGKTRTLNFLKQVFEGKDKNCLLNGNLFSKDDYFIFYISEEDNILLEKGLGTKSLLKPELKRALVDYDYIKQENDFAAIVVSFNEYFNQTLSFGNLVVKLDVKIEDLLSKFLTVEFKGENIEKLSFTQKRLLYYELIFDLASKQSMPICILIDEPFLGLSIKGKHALVKMLTERMNILNEDSILFIASSEPFYGGFNCIYIQNEILRNDLIYEEDWYRIYAKIHKCSLSDAKEYVFEEEIEEFKNKIKQYYDFELMFINRDENIVDYDDFIAFILNKIEL